MKAKKTVLKTFSDTDRNVEGLADKRLARILISRDLQYKIQSNGSFNFKSLRIFWTVLPW